MSVSDLLLAKLTLESEVCSCFVVSLGQVQFLCTPLRVSFSSQCMTKSHK